MKAKTDMKATSHGANNNNNTSKCGDGRGGFRLEVRSFAIARPYVRLTYPMGKLASIPREPNQPRIFHCLNHEANPLWVGVGLSPPRLGGCRNFTIVVI
jgi:hypothetical protein